MIVRILETCGEKKIAISGFNSKAENHFCPLSSYFLVSCCFSVVGRSEGNIFAQPEATFVKEL